MTRKLESEAQNIQCFEDYCRRNNIQILKYISPEENKSLNTDADAVVLLPSGVKQTVSLKSRGGVMATLNSGAGSRSVSKWMTPKEVDLVKIAEKECKARRASIKYERWADVPDAETVKYYVIEPLYEAWFSVLSENSDAVSRFSTFLSARSSDLLFVEDKFVPYTLFHGTTVKKINSKSILVGNFELRFKSEGGKTKSSIKVNGSWRKL